MRITFVVPAADLSGGFRVIVAYAQRLTERGHDVIVVSRPVRPPRFLAKLRASLKGRQGSMPDSMTHLDGADIKHRMIGEHRPIRADDLPEADVVIATWWETAEWVARLPASKGVKVHFIQDYEVWAGSVERVDATCRLAMPKITPAAWVKTMLEERFGADDVTLVPNSVDLVTFAAPPRGKQPRPTVGLVYTPFKNKGCDVSIEAIRLARQIVPDLHVVSFGNVMPSAALLLPEDTEFVFCAPEMQLKEIYSKADLWLFGTRIEGFGLPILEAMACGTPVVGTPAGAAPELLTAGGGKLVPMEDATAMAEEVVRVARMSDADWRKWSREARLNASRYTWDAATDRFERVLQRLTERHGSTRQRSVTQSRNQ